MEPIANRGSRPVSLPGGDTAAHAARFGARMQRFARFPDDPKVCLLEPLYPPEAAWGSVKVEQGYLPPLGTISIYRWLRANDIQVDFVDTQFGDYRESDLRSLLREKKYDLIGLPLFTPTASHVFNTAALIREELPDCVIVFGGVHATSMPFQTFAECPDVDFIIRGEGEWTMVELISALSEHRSSFEGIAGLSWWSEPEAAVSNEDRPVLADLTELPVGMFGDLNLDRYVPHPTQYVRLPNYPVVMQRGCPYPCSFCEASVALGKKLRLLPVDRVLEELKILKYEKGARGIYFQDSTFTIHRKYIVEVLEGMVREGLNDLLWSCTTRTDRVDPDLLALMHEAGCRNILYGIESGNQQSLDVIRKNVTVEKQTEAVGWTHKARITMTNSFILAIPGETEEMVKNTIDYAKSLAAQMSLFYLPVPYPGSDLYSICKASGGIREHDSWSEFLSIDFDDPIYVNPKIGKDRMRYWYRRAYLEYYSHPRVWYSNLKALTWNGGAARYVRGVNALRALLMHRAGNAIRQPYHQSSAPLADN